jgi:hypothetical protein
MRLFLKKAPANFVPAAAVIRGEQALFVFTGHKTLDDGSWAVIF